MPEPMRYEVRNAEAERVLKDIGRLLKDVMPPGFGFTLLIFSYGNEGEKGGELYYMSSAERQGIIDTMREFIKRFEEN